MHTLNVVVHISFGVVALFLGLITLCTRKGSAAHIRYGRYFIGSLAVVVVTAAIGAIAFVFRPFLGVITLLSAYEGYSGYRVLRIRKTGLRFHDAIVAAAGLAATFAFILFAQSSGVAWSAVIIYPTLGTLALVSAYDLSRFAFPRAWLRRTWIYEHLFKMIGACSAVVSAFAGTVLVAWQPASQIAPSILGTLAVIGFAIQVHHQSSSRGSKPANPAVNTTA